jgi:subtilisin family serine protease
MKSGINRGTIKATTLGALASLGVGIVGIVGVSISSAQSPDRMDVEARVKMAAVQRAAGNSVGLTVSEGTNVTLPLSGRQIRRFKVRGIAGPIEGLDVDQTTQDFVNADALIAEELSEIRKRRGKRTNGLDDSIKGKDAAEIVEVSLEIQPETGPEGAFKSPIDGNGRTPKVTRAQGDALRKANEDGWENKLREPRRRLLAELSKHGIDVTAGRKRGSAVYAMVPVGKLAELGRIADVAVIESVSNNAENELGVVANNLNYDPEIHSGLGLRGDGITVGIVEPEAGRIATHPNMTNVITPNSGTIQTHATRVAGVIKSNSATNPGYAPNATLRHNGSATESTRKTIFDSHITNGARSVSASYASGTATDRAPGGEDKFFDEKFTVSWVLPIKSAGNRGQAGCTAGTDGHTTHPGLGYNTLTVGGTTSTLNGMYNCSSFTDPSSTTGDREKPELAAPSVSINMPNTSNGFSADSGTSYAAPGVNGVAALMLQAEPGLNIWPEIMKAILMATATTNIEGNAVLSDQDGVGAINPLAAVQVTQGTNGNWNGSGYLACNSTFPHVVSMNLQAGRRTRVVAVWHQDNSYVDYSNRPGADLDLEIYGPSNVFIGRANRYDDTYEVIEFVPGTTANYNASVLKWRCDMDPKYIGIAWYQVP